MNDIQSCRANITSFKTEYERLSQAVMLKVHDRQNKLLATAKNSRDLDHLINMFEDHKYKIDSVIRKAKARRYSAYIAEYESDYKKASNLFTYEQFVKKYTKVRYDPKGYVNELSLKSALMRKEIELEVEQKRKRYLLKELRNFEPI